MTNNRIQQLASIIETQEAGLKDLWDRFEHETRLYLNTDCSDEEQCTRSADAGADYQRAKQMLKALRKDLVVLRKEAGHTRFDRQYPERNLPA